MNPAHFSPFANHLWQSTLFAGASALLTLALRKNRARIRHGVWVVASCKFLLPLSVLIALGGHLRSHTVLETAPSSLFLALHEASQPFAVPAFAPPVLATESPTPSPLPAVLLGIWVCGFLGIACSWWVRWRRIRTAVHAGSTLRLEIPIKARSSPVLLEPGVFGVFQPVLLLPEGIFDRLTPAQLKSVIAHEVCHVRHRDNLIAAIHMFVETVFWFHPLVWWIGKRMVEERERACDEEVLRLGGEPRVYADGILNVCKLYVESPLVCMSGVTGSNLKKRIEEIMTRPIVKPLSSGRRLLMAGTALLAVMGPVFMGVMSGPHLRAQSEAAILVKPAGPKFEVASIKPVPLSSAGPPAHVGIKIDAARVDIGYWSIRQLILRAYGLPSYQLTGPDWMNNCRFDVAAKFLDGTTQDQLPQMLQWLLAERFGLVAHSETTDLPAFALVVGKGGPKMRPAAPDADDSVELASTNRLERVGRTLDNLWSYDKSFGGAAMSITDGVLHGEFKKMTMDGLAQLLASQMRAPVIDLTGLEGKYQVTLDLPVPGGDTSTMDAFTSVFSMVQRLGLKLEQRKARIAVLVVDHVERVPTEN